MRIVTLIENLVYNQGLVAEHGLSIYIETDKKKILFDTGQSGLFLQNADKLGISIEDVDCVVLSHGHHDHTGGLYPFLEINIKAKVYAKSSIFTTKYSGRANSIGTPENAELIKNRMVYVDVITEIAENIFIIPDVPISDSTDTHFTGFTKKAGNELVPDEFDDELSLVIKQDDQINIITACSHRGITNICKASTEHFKLPVGLILGGFHTKDYSIEQFRQIIQYFRLLQPQSIGVCHCTGVEKYSELLRNCEAHVFYNFTGKEICI